jgi:hypothetical protein
MSDMVLSHLSKPASPSSPSPTHAGTLASQDLVVPPPPRRSVLLDLPDELLTLVCASLTYRCSISDVMQTCHRLYEIAEPFFFADVSYRNPYSSASLVGALLKKRERPLWVRELHLGFYHYRESPFDHDFDLLSLIPLFANLEKVELRYRSYSTVFLDTHIISRLDDFHCEHGPGSAHLIDKGRWVIETLKRLFAFNSVWAAGSLSISEVVSTRSPLMSEASTFTPHPPQGTFSRLRCCTIYGDRTGGLPEIWSIFLTSGTIRSITLVACHIEDIEIADAGMQRTTPLQELILRFCSITAPSLKKIMSLPKALEKLVVLAPTVRPQKDRPQVLLDAVQVQKQSLRVIEIDHYFDKLDTTNRLDFIDFEPFDRLHTISIDQETRSRLPRGDATRIDQTLG